jgi:hypothetical protein
MTLGYKMLRAPLDFTLPDTFTVDHNKLASLESFKTTRYSDRLFYTDARAELNILTSALIASGDTPKAVFKTESPDFRLTLSSGVEVFVEITTAIAASEARADNVIAELNFAVSSLSLSDPVIVSRLEGYALTFFMPFPPRAAMIDSTMAELKSFLQETDLAELSHERIVDIPTRFQNLHELGVKVLCLHRGVTFAQVTRGAMSVELPWDAAKVIHDAIERKRSMAASWPTPLWLIVWISGHYYSPDEMLSSFRLNSDGISPFSRIYIGGGRSVLLISAEEQSA